MRHLWIAVMMVSLALAGCADESFDYTEGGDGASSDAASGEVSAQQQSNGRWIARRTDSASGAFSAGDDVRAITVNGAVAVGQGGSSGFAVTARLWAYGDSKTEAEARLEQVRLQMRNGADAEVTAPSWEDRGGDLIVRVAVPEVDDVTAKTTNGAVGVEDLDAQTIDARTSNGAIECEASADELVLKTTNGAIDCVARVQDATVSTGNGQVELEFEPSASGTWDIDATNGVISLLVDEGPSVGYDVKARTTNGQITFDFEDTQTVSQESTFTGGSRHERTQGFAGRTIQTTVTLDTTNGAISAGS